GRADPARAIVARAVPLLSSAIGRNAYPARTIIGLVGIVGNAIGSPAILAPAHMGFAQPLGRLLVGQSAADDDAGDEGGGRKPPAIMLAIARPTVAIAAMAIEIGPVSPAFEAVAPIFAAPIFAVAGPVLHLDRRG